MIRVFYGEDTFRSREAYLAARAEAAHTATVPVTVLRDEQLTPRAVEEALAAQSLFTRAALPVAFERLTTFTGEQAEVVSRALQSVPRERVVLVWEDGVPPAQGIAWRALKKYGDLEESAPLSEDELLAWVQRRLAGTGRTIDRAALDALLASCGFDLWNIASELDKLVLAREAGPIPVADVAELVPTSLTVDVFATVRAVVAGDPRTALRLLAHHRRAGTEPRRLLALVIRELRLLLQVRDALERRSRLSPWEVSRDLRVPRFVAEQLLRTARGTSLAVLRGLFDRCVVALYHLNTGRADGGEILESLVTLPRVRQAAFAPRA